MQLCTNTVVAVLDPLLFVRVTDTVVSKYGSVVDEVDPLPYSFVTSTVTTLDTSVDDGSAADELFVDRFVAAAGVKRSGATSTVVTTSATDVPVATDPVCTSTVVPVDPNVTRYVLFVDEPFDARTTDTTTDAAPSVKLSVVPLAIARCSASASTESTRPLRLPAKYDGAHVGTVTVETLTVGAIDRCDGCDVGCRDG